MTGDDSSSPVSERSNGRSHQREASEETEDQVPSRAGQHFAPFDPSEASITEPNGGRFRGNLPSSGGKPQAAFIHKLSLMVSTSSLVEHISWSDDGTSFTVFQPSQFAAKVLPMFFKHNNFASFVRQLNMYGFRKVNDVFNGAPNASSAASKASWEFNHSLFQRDRPDLLPLIKRKSSKGNTSTMTRAPSSPSGSTRSSRGSSAEPVTSDLPATKDFDRPRPRSSGESASKRQRVGWPEDHSDGSLSRGTFVESPNPISSGYSAHESHRQGSAPYARPPSQYQTTYTSFQSSGRSPHFPPPEHRYPPPSSSYDITGQLAGVEHQLHSLSNAFRRNQEDIVAERSATTTVLRLMLRLVTSLDTNGDRREECEMAHAAIASLEAPPCRGPTANAGPPPSNHYPYDDSRRSSTNRPYHSVLAPSQDFARQRPAESFARRSEHESDSSTPYLSQGGSFSTASSGEPSRPYSGRSPTQGSFVILPRPRSSEAPSHAPPPPSGSTPKPSPNWNAARLPSLASLAGVGDLLRRREDDG